MLDKKIIVEVAILALLGTTMALGATSQTVSGSGIVTSTAIEAELLINGGPNISNILVVTDENHYLVNGKISNPAINGDSVQFSGIDIASGTPIPYTANATKTGLHTWTLELTENQKTVYPINGNLQIN